MVILAIQLINKNVIQAKLLVNCERLYSISASKLKPLMKSNYTYICLRKILLSYISILVSIIYDLSIGNVLVIF